jgi:hypothetical protein
MSVARVFSKQPAFAAATALTLALGIGATTAIFSVVYGVLLKSLPFHDPERLVSLTQIAPHGAGLSATTLPLLRVHPMLGRAFSAEDDRRGAPRRVMLTHGCWQRRFGGAEDVVGRQLVIDGRPTEVIGVLPASFRFLRTRPSIVLPMPLDVTAPRA